MNNITLECRHDSLHDLSPGTRQQDILNTLGNTSMTARQIADTLGFNDLNAVKPRLTELVHFKRVEAVDKVKDYATGRSVSVYRRVENGSI